jgi:hypothetical protein
LKESQGYLSKPYIKKLKSSFDRINYLFRDRKYLAELPKPLTIAEKIRKTLDAKLYPPRKKRLKDI